MKASITKDGQLRIDTESEIEFFALKAALGIDRPGWPDLYVSGMGGECFNPDGRGYVFILRRERKEPDHISDAEEIIEELQRWTTIYGNELRPPRVDTYGNGVRDSKTEVRDILNRPRS